MQRSAGGSQACLTAALLLLYSHALGLTRLDLALVFHLFFFLISRFSLFIFSPKL